jgi:integration host factor subunit alpha
VTKEDIINRIWENLNFTKKQSGEVVEELIDCLKETLKDGEKLKVGGFGVFEVRQRKARIGRNPRTGEKAQIKEGKTIKFKPGKTLKLSVDK